MTAKPKPPARVWLCHDSVVNWWAINEPYTDPRRDFTAWGPYVLDPAPTVTELAGWLEEGAIFVPNYTSTTIAEYILGKWRER